MIVATALFYAFECISLQDRCSYAHPYDVKESFLQLCLATLSLHCNPLPLGRGAATPTQKRRAESPSRQSKALHIVRYCMPFKSLNVSRARERRMDRLTDHQERRENTGQRIRKPRVHTTIQHISQVNRTRSDDLGVRKVTDRYLIDDKGGRSGTNGDGSDRRGTGRAGCLCGSGAC